ncbi:ribosome production factor 1-like [Branchiostoma floridae]|uniref:Ribosome production factor 1 n=2 Tax=Branchiostoma floridae TaxID=7739 RepID=A0A9J7MFN6_BRAFL|nr:ribosome production factor 1-like [Branchiostoma floridae]
MRYPPTSWSIPNFPKMATSKKKKMPVREETQDVDNDSAMAVPSSAIPPPNISSIKNKMRRTQEFIKLKRQRRKEKKELQKKKKREAEALGDEAPPKKVPKTIENMRVFDETMVDPQDEEVLHDEAHDEMASYFTRDSRPKVLITSSDRPRSTTTRFLKELGQCIPNSEIYYRRGLDLKKVIPQALAKEFTDIIVINEDRRKPNGMLLCHLPDGPTAHFKISNVKLHDEIKRAPKSTEHHPEVILNNFNTRLGHTVGRMFAALFPHDPQFSGRQAVTFHNQRDFIFFRHHRYLFKNNKRVGLNELGPRFTLKLRSLQKGTFDSKFGEYEWVHKRHEMDTSRRKFFL